MRKTQSTLKDIIIMSNPPLQKTILSFDVGIRHLSFCQISYSDNWNVNSCQVQKWEVLDLGPVSSVEQCSLVLTQKLIELFPLESLNIDTVLIERQPKSRSIIMVAVQMFLCSYFTLGQVKGSVGQVRFISAQRKLAMNACPEVVKAKSLEDSKKSAKVSYAANKKYAIMTARHYLEHVIRDFANLVLLDMYPKKDDLSDSLLQALSYVETHGQVSRIYSKKAKKTRKDARKV